MIVRLLGSGGFMPTGERETCCALLRDGRDVLLIDAGTGVRRLVTEPELLAGVERLHVVLTHFHLDHVVGLFYLAELELPVEIWGAGTRLEGVRTQDLVDRLLAPPFAPPSIRRAITRARELTPEAGVGPFRVGTRVQRMHSNPTVALCVGGLAWCTDTGYDADNVEFARGARILFHEAFRASDTATHDGHTAAGDAGRLAAEAGAERLVLIHLPPNVDDGAFLRFARAHFTPTVLGRDGLELEV